MADSEQMSVMRIAKDFDVRDLDSPEWKKAQPAAVGRYWSGDSAPAGRHFIARLLWSANAFYVRFEANQIGPIIVSDRPDLTKKTIGLWDRDVCEIFIAPEIRAPNKYYEFEIAPTGEWIDLGIEVTPKERLTDWKYTSQMESAARVDKDKIVMAIKIPFVSLGKVPKAGDVWLGNLFRCVGSDPNRGYLAWRPTETKIPAFHVPEAFGEFIFAGH